jgi:carbonic anhydrase
MSTKELINKYSKFKNEYAKENADLLKDLVENGQHPKTLFITCSDSRVAPNFITQTQPGDLFIARNIGNFVPPFDPSSEASATPAAIEYAVSALKVENIIVCGHTECGACKSLHQVIPEDDVTMTNVRKWLKFADSVKNKAITAVGKDDPKALYKETEKLNIIDQIENLLTYPAIKKRVEEGNLFVQGWYYHLDGGDLEYYDHIKEEFLPIEKSLENPQTHS